MKGNKGSYRSAFVRGPKAVLSAPVLSFTSSLVHWPSLCSSPGELATRSSDTRTVAPHRPEVNSHPSAWLARPGPCTPS